MVKHYKINRLNDVFFKSLMGDKNRKEITLSFLNAVLKEDSDDIFVDVSFSEQEIEPTMEGGKAPRLDIVAVLNDGTQVDIEVQVNNQDFIVERSLMYWSRLYSNQMVSGDDYDSLKKVVVIDLLAFNHLTEKSWHNIAQFTIKDSHRVITDHIQMHFLELPKLKLKDLRRLRRIEAWGAYFSGKYSKMELEEIIMAEPAIKRALDYEHYFTQDDALRRKYEMRQDGMRDWTTSINAAERKGEAKGIARGITKGIKQGRQQEKLNNAKNLLDAGISMQIISKSLGLTIAQLEQLQHNNNHQD